jgi:uncharacterized protein
LALICVVAKKLMPAVVKKQAWLSLCRMIKLTTVFASLALLNSLLWAQPARHLVGATGNASVSVKPDQAKVDVGVITQAATAQDAAAQNASQVDSVLAQLRSVLGPMANIKTISYSLNPNYRYPQGAPPVLTGYTASNTVEVTMSDLSLVGRTIDAASQAGANTVQGLRFTLQDEEPVRQQALGLATKQAKAHAQAIASGLGATLGAVVSAQEGGGTILPPLTNAASAASTQTPIETGMVEIRATVSIQIELIQ